MLLVFFVGIQLKHIKEYTFSQTFFLFIFFLIKFQKIQNLKPHYQRGEKVDEKCLCFEKLVNVKGQVKTKPKQN